MPSSLGRLLDHLRGRGALALIVAAIALVARCATPAPPARTTFAVAQMLGDAVGGAVGPDDFVWEERGGFLRDALLGRRVLFLAARRAPDGRESADLYRAQVRLTRTGRPIGLHTVRNLTATPAGDDRGLVARGRRAAFVTTAPGGVQGVTLLDLAGDPPEARTRGERLLAAIEGWLETGSPGGVARTEIAFRTPPPEVLVDLGDELLLMALGPERTPAAVDLRSFALNTGGKEAFGPEVRRVPRPARSFVEVATLAARRLLDEGAAQRVERAALALERRIRPPAPEPPPPYGAQAPANAPGPWPPRAIAPAIEPTLPGEGAWVAAGAPPAEPAGGAEPAFYMTFLRPEPRLPEARVHLLAIDTRRVELRLQAGHDAPRPVGGPRGSGRLPAPPASAAAGQEGAAAAPEPVERVIGALALGADPEAGMAHGGRVLVPPRPDAPTLAIGRHGHALVGPWTDGEAVPEGLTALFQAAPRPPDGAWDDDLVTERAALCLAPGGFLVHAWGRALDAPALVRALTAAGCEASLELGRRPAPLGVAWLTPREGGWVAERLLPGMSLSPERLVTASPGPLALLVLRDPTPPARPRRAAWAADGATQPQPGWLPAVHTAEVINLGARVRLHAFSPERFELRLRAGRREISPRGAPELPETLTPAEHARALAAVGLGIGRRRGARGLIIGGAVGLRLRKDALLAVQGRRAEILPPGAAPPPGADVTEVALTAEGGKLLPAARQITAMRRRAAACVLDDGTLVIATTTFDSDEATTEALLDLGCSRVAALDRGARRRTFLHRAGAPPPPAEPPPAPAREPEPDDEPAEDANEPKADADEPAAEPPAPEPPPVLQAGYDDTTLFLLEVPMPGRARPLSP